MRLRERIAVLAVDCVIVMLILQFIQYGFAQQCHSAQWAEQLICSDELMNTYAQQVRQHYDELIHQLTTTHRVELIYEVKRQQLAWQRQQNACVSQKNSHHCLLNIMTSRISELDRLLETPYFSPCSLAVSSYQNDWLKLKNRGMYLQACH